MIEMSHKDIKKSVELWLLLNGHPLDGDIDIEIKKDSIQINSGYLVIV